MEKKYLFSPGPTMLPPEVLLKMAEPIMHHREPEFEKIFAEIREGLKYLFQTKNEVLIFTSSGTGAMEGAVSNILSKGDKALVVRGGKFGERWAEICKAYEIEFVPIDVEWGKAVNPEQIQKALESNHSIRAVYTQASETSTGVRHPIPEIAEIVKRYEETVLVVDAITGIGVFNLPMDAWGIDVLISGSQKALMLPPGLAFAALSDKAWKFVERSDLPKYYFDFKKELKSSKKNQSSYTPAISLFVGLREALRLIQKEGREGVFQRHERLAMATRAAVKALGLELYAPDSPSNAVTAVKVPGGIDGERLKDLFFEKFGITVAEGQDRAKGKIIRIAHLGYYERLDMVMVISALEMLLKEMGHKFELGTGVKAAEEILMK
ncbi:MAG TPA: alanine--glyoxylate aminotransferase family protein [Thermodesulfobacteriota bacterium]|jgi:aspartate aminotransferase-like enzyme|nr:alanine--glyoxylate aminotransferase family protein [Thermodesulfobacteriota bacterium]